MVKRLRLLNWYIIKKVGIHNYKDLAARNRQLFQQLKGSLQSKPMSWREVLKVKGSGVYFILLGRRIIYVGQTERGIKDRMRELGSDFRSHTLNRKLLQKTIEKTTNHKLARLSNTAKSELVRKHVLSTSKFEKCVAATNTYIQTKLRYRFLLVPKTELSTWNISRSP